MTIKVRSKIVNGASEIVINAAIVGFGKSGQKIHAPLLDLTEGIELAAVVSRSAPDIIPGRQSVQVVRSINELLDLESIDLVIITLPNHLHYSTAKKALENGKHVVVDKPFTVTAGESDSLIGLAAENEKLLSVFQNRRLDGDFLTIKKLIDEDAVGKITEFESNFNRFRKELREDAWKEKDLPGSGILYDLSPHLIDQTVELFGLPKSLYADVRSQRGGEADDWFEINFYYDGFTAKLRAGMLVLDETPRFILRGDTGSFVKYGFDTQEDELSKGEHLRSSEWRRESAENYGELRKIRGGKISSEQIETIPGDYPAFYSNIVDSIQNSTELLVKPEEARDVISLIELCLKSAKEGRVLECD